MTGTTQELEPTASLVCAECGAERPGQAHDPLCPQAEGDVAALTEDDDESGTLDPRTEVPVEVPTEEPPVQQSAAGWVLRITPEHTCIKPAIDNQTFVGSVWRCGECGQNWLVYERRGKKAGEKAFKRLAAEKVDELISKNRDRLAKAAAART